MNSAPRFVLLGLLTLLSLGCAEDIVDREPVVVKGRVLMYEDGVAVEHLGPRPGVTVCYHHDSESVDTYLGDCVVSNEDGYYELGSVPYNSRVLLSYCDDENCAYNYSAEPDSDAIVPTLRMLSTTDSKELFMAIQTPVMSWRDMHSLAATMKEEGLDDLSVANFLPPTKGLVQFFAVDAGDSPLSKVRVEIYLDQDRGEFFAGDEFEVDGEMVTLLEGVVYTPETGEPRDGLEETSSKGVGVLERIVPGKYGLKFYHSRLTEQSMFSDTGWDAGEYVEVKVVAGFMTAMVGVQFL
ncbi:MAG: hypothetical protein HRU17_06620 [Polyangiaceae bacterium]|nr:hypothetical protein [Polyangiaceae bacterium]